MKSKKTTSLKNRTLRKLILHSEEFNHCIEHFEQWLRVFGFAPSTVYYSPAYLKSFFHYLEGVKIFQIADISNHNLNNYMQFLFERRNLKTCKRLSLNYRLNHLNAIKLFSRYLLESSKGSFDISYRFTRDVYSRKKWLQKKDISALYKACLHGILGDLNRVLLGVYYGLGLRRMEGIGLDITDINVQTGMVYVRHAKYNQMRVVPISRKILEDIQNYRRRYRYPLLNKAGKVNELALLVSERGNRLTGNAAYARIQSLAEKSGLETPLAIHTLRHSIATHLLENGLNLESIGQFLGHKSLESTQIYTHLIHKNYE